MIDYTKKPKATNTATQSVKLVKGQTINLTQAVKAMGR